MNLNQIRYFLAVVDEGTFTRAARRCGVSQPSLTNAIKALELRLGHSLFDRGLHGATLTTRGELLRPHLERILKSVDELFLISNQDVRVPNSHAEKISPREPRSRFKRRHGTVQLSISIEIESGFHCDMKCLIGSKPVSPGVSTTFLPFTPVSDTVADAVF